MGTNNSVHGIHWKSCLDEGGYAIRGLQCITIYKSNYAGAVLHKCVIKMKIMLIIAIHICRKIH